MKIKKGASVKGLRPEMLLAIWIIDAINYDYGVRTLITSGSDEHPKRLAWTLHDDGLAVDLRHPGLNAARMVNWHDDIVDALGPEYDIVVEKDHVHVEYQP